MNRQIVLSCLWKEVPSGTGMCLDLNGSLLQRFYENGARRSGCVRLGEKLTNEMFFLYDPIRPILEFVLLGKIDVK